MAVIDPEADLPATLFFGGGPGVDLTRLAGFVPRREVEAGGPLVVIGEPGSALEPTPDCAAALGELADQILTGEQGPVVVDPCREFFGQVLWTDDLIRATLDDLIGHDVHVGSVVSYSFGSRVYEAFLSVDRSGASRVFDEVRSVLLASPAPGGTTAGSDVVAMRRDRFTEVMESEGAPWCQSDQECASDPRWAIAAVSAAYSLDQNRAAFADLAVGADGRTADRDALVEGLLLLDTEQQPTAHFGRFLAIACSAYRDWDPEVAVTDLFGLLFGPCASIAEDVDPMPAAVGGGSEGTMPPTCVFYSAADPVSGLPEAESVNASVTGQGVPVILVSGVPAGHVPRAILAADPSDRNQSCDL